MQTPSSDFSTRRLAIIFLSRTARQGHQASNIACLDRADPHHACKRLQYALSVSLPTLPQPTRDMTSGTAVLRRNPETRSHLAEDDQAPITTAPAQPIALTLARFSHCLCHRRACSKSIVEPLILNPPKQHASTTWSALLLASTMPD